MGMALRKKVPFKQVPKLKRHLVGLKGREKWRGTNRFPALLIHRFYMKQAIREAKRAASLGEVPVGAVLVHRGRVVSRSANRIEGEKNGLNHAEMLCLQEASHSLGRYLNEATLYVTLEPCVMCAGAVGNMRLGRLVFGAWDKERGACGSVTDVMNLPNLFQKTELLGGLMEEDCRKLLTSFFRELRGKGQKKR